MAFIADPWADLSFGRASRTIPFPECAKTVHGYSIKFNECFCLSKVTLADMLPTKFLQAFKAESKDPNGPLKNNGHYTIPRRPKDKGGESRRAKQGTRSKEGEHVTGASFVGLAWGYHEPSFRWLCSLLPYKSRSLAHGAPLRRAYVPMSPRSSVKTGRLPDLWHGLLVEQGTSNARGRPQARHGRAAYRTTVQSSLP